MGLRTPSPTGISDARSGARGLQPASRPDARRSISTRPGPGFSGGPDHQSTGLDGRRRGAHQGLPSAQHARVRPGCLHRRDGLRRRRLGTDARRPGARQGQRLLRGMRAGFSRSAPVDGRGRRVAHPDGTRRGYRRGDRCNPGEGPSCHQDHSRVRLQAGPLLQLRRTDVATLLGRGCATEGPDILHAGSDARLGRRTRGIRQ